MKAMTDSRPYGEAKFSLATDGGGHGGGGGGD
jgi:hypothetical protein